MGKHCVFLTIDLSVMSKFVHDYLEITMFTPAYALNSINGLFGSLFWQPGPQGPYFIEIWVSISKLTGPY